MFDFSLGNFRLKSSLATDTASEARRSRIEGAVSKRVFVTGKDDGRWQGLTSDGRRVSDLVDPYGYDWTKRWVTAEKTETGWMIVGIADSTSGEPDPITDGDE